jgi:hypothetical protein
MALEENIQKLRDSLGVTSAQTLRHEAMLKDHAAWLHSHDLATIAHEEWLKAHEEAVAQHDREMAEIRMADAERGRVLDERIANLVSAIGKIIREGNGKS